MEKRDSIFMVNSAIFAFDYLSKHPGALPEEIIKEFLKSPSSRLKGKNKETQLYEVAAINKLCKIKNKNKLKTKKQVMHIFVNSIGEIAREMEPPVILDESEN